MDRKERRALFQRMVKELKDERLGLVKRIADIDAELTEYGVGATKKAVATSTSTTKPKGKVPRAGSLKARILGVVSATPMSTSEIGDAVIASGLQSVSKTFRQSLSIALGQLTKDAFIGKVKRGTWKAL